MKPIICRFVLISVIALSYNSLGAWDIDTIAYCDCSTKVYIPEDCTGENANIVSGCDEPYALDGDWFGSISMQVSLGDVWLTGFILYHGDGPWFNIAFETKYDTLNSLKEYIVYFSDTYRYLPDWPTVCTLYDSVVNITINADTTLSVKINDTWYNVDETLNNNYHETFVENYNGFNRLKYSGKADLVISNLVVGPVSTTGIEKPDYSAGENYPSLNHSIIYYTLDGKSIDRSNLKRLPSGIYVHFNKSTNKPVLVNHIK